MLNQWTPKTTLIVAGVAVIGVWYLKGKAVETVKDVGNAVSPANRDNVFNRGFNWLYSEVTGSEDSLGADIADGVYNVREWWNEW